VPEKQRTKQHFRPIALRNYQTDAIDRLLEASRRILRTSEGGICVFQAPTGSGKTIMVAEFLKKLVLDQKGERHFSFIWIAVRRLHDQSKDKLERYYADDNVLTCSYYDDLNDKRIAENEILFINWDSINKRDVSLIIKESEEQNDLNTVLQNTREEGRDLVLVIDESHHTASSERSRELISIINPHLTLEVSATPQIREGVRETTSVYLEAVKEEQMIKSEVLVNPEFMKIKVGERSSDEIVIDEALKKRSELAKLYKDEGSEVNPLVLVQLPDRREGLEDKKDQVLSIFRNKFNITEDNGKLAVWLSEEKSDTLPNIEENDNETEVLLFKTAIALGWDCPRASILVVFRESKSFTFTIQTIGRIMRMPEFRYYSHSELNKGYVFTNLASIEITEDFVKDYISIFEAKRRNDIYSSISLPSVYLKRQRARTRLSGDFVKIFQEVAAAEDLESKITTNPTRIAAPILSDGRIVNSDRLGEVEQKGKIEVPLNPEQLNARYERFISDCCAPFASYDSSDRLKSALYTFFEKKFGIARYSPEVEKIVLGVENVSTITDTITQAKLRYKREVVDKLNSVREREVTEKWEVPTLITYSTRYVRKESPLSIMEPLYIRSPSAQEVQFIERLDDSKAVAWWFRNGEGEAKYFGIPYTDQHGDWNFYPDFIVRFIDGKLGFYDTKAGFTAERAGPKAEGLQVYLKAQRKAGRNLDGGIIEMRGRTAMINRLQNYRYDSKTLPEEWEPLEL
jgi:type III restriction enzyme